MRTPYRDGFFDIVINTDSFTGFPVEDMRQSRDRITQH